MLVKIATAATAGIAGAFSFAPNMHWWLMPPALGTLFYLVKKSNSAYAAAVSGLAFGFAFFATGLSWIFEALNGYIQLPLPAATAIMILLCLALALYPATAVYAARRIGTGGMIGALTLSTCWGLGEWLRGQLFTGFPWLAIGYSQVPISPLTGWLPVIGINGVNVLLTLTAALLATLPTLLRRHQIATIFIIIVIFGGGQFSRSIKWTQPAGEIRISLLQGNVAQTLKWRDGEIKRAMMDYLRLAKESDGQLVILPETAIPMRQRDIPVDYLEALRQIAATRNGVVLSGMFVDDGGLHNAAVAIEPTGIGNDYRKRHLTPYGEYLPFASLLAPILLAADIPYMSLQAGNQKSSLSFLNTHAGISICYEDAFGDEWRHQLPEARFLINITNDGWFDGSAMLAQHRQLSQARAVEFGRWLARATNTGSTAVIDHNGHIAATLPLQKQGTLNATIMQRTGTTPYVQFGDWPVLLLILGWLAAAIWRKLAH
ncbi:apolipoprotein N-acyltransferase [Candidatus Persebacteraceae bacterium Df01]|uniref:Apolipoprotein N-acyltransferase n=1 Tax=Candidatus Doriopsillibacter californiensis TaxID=2970740 RepID=A0ABT7QNB6_9GAMM|nr:apolipoprotein N-acyltransferase [Candidatus Persebacteraceae bacterium Df01]